MDDDWPTYALPEDDGPTPGQDWLDMINDATSYLSVHLLFTYTFTILSLYFIYRNYRRFIRMRQLFSLEFVHSIPARTVMVQQLPQHLQNEKALAEYFETMGLSVESINICREVASLKKLIDKRTDALLKLESAWVSYLGNPAVMETPRTADQDVMPLVDVDEPDVEDQRKKFVLPNRKRPTLRPGWFKPKVDALEYLGEEFRKMDELVNKRRRSGRFKATHTAFVTFEKMSSAVCLVPQLLFSPALTRHFEANCDPNCPRHPSSSMYYSSRSRGTRHHMVGNGTSSWDRVCTRIHRSCCDVSAVLLLGLPSLCTG